MKTKMAEEIARALALRVIVTNEAGEEQCRATLGEFWTDNAAEIRGGKRGVGRMARADYVGIRNEGCASHNFGAGGIFRIRPETPCALRMQLERLGFAVEDTGGGCQWWRKPVEGSSFSLVVTDGEAGLPDDAGSCWFGVMSDAHSEELASKTYATGADLARVLSFQP